MTEERDPKVSKRYRGLGREEPPRDLDERILAASRRTAGAGKYRWAGPLAAAAVLMLAVGVALQVERREEPKEMVAKVEAPAPVRPPAAPPPAFAPEPRPQEPSREMRARPESRAAAAPEAAPAPRMEDARRDRSVDELAQKREQPVPGAPVAADEANAAAAVASRRDAQSGARQPEARARAATEAAPVAALAKAQQSPEQWVERIAQLRREGKHDEADRQLAEFRRTYPEYRLSEETKAKVERSGEPARK